MPKATPTRIAAEKARADADASLLYCAECATARPLEAFVAKNRRGFTKTCERCRARVRANEADAHAALRGFKSLYRTLIADLDSDTDLKAA